ncbi:MAG: MarR family transcriptional regulator [Mycobacterium sp.]|jgi:DNA-binding MarR family transcriptional regulator|nr:MarR family transcriptional regulator [Mycobacterium sp.]
MEQSYCVSREDVAEGLEQAAILIVRHMSDPAALNLTASMALDTLTREGAVRVTTLAGAAGIGQPSMTELVQRLERQGLVTRINDPQDGRAALVTITNAGRALLDDQRSHCRDRLAELLAALPAEDEATLTLALHVALPIIRRLIHNATNPAGLGCPENPRRSYPAPKRCPQPPSGAASRAPSGRCPRRSDH